MHADERCPANFPASKGSAADADEPLDIDQIQGNILGFNKPFQHFIFVNFARADRDRVLLWLEALLPDITTVRKVRDFREEYAEAKEQHRPPPTALWRNIAFSYAGLCEFGTLPLAGLPQDFSAGMAAHAPQLGDVGPSAPENWRFAAIGNDDSGVGGGWERERRFLPLHALVILAADDDVALRREVRTQLAAIRDTGSTIAFEQPGQDIPQKRGYEHFGFRDGVSQPGFRGEHRLNKPGQDPIWPGEFVLGYRRQHPQRADDSRPPDTDQPAWTKNGSYLVFRRLRQDVRGFNDFVEAQAATLGLTPELLRAKLIGRYRSGAPLAELRQPVAGSNAVWRPADPHDPGAAGGPLLGERTSNDFDYRTDVAGNLVPRGAHIRRLNPRAQEEPGREIVQTKRILRRAITYATADGNDRGLLFICYQSSIADQFAFLQQNWAHNPHFPPALGAHQSGPDPLSGALADGARFHIPGAKGDYATLQSWVTMTGGDYFFSPSLATLADLAREKVSEEGTMYTKEPTDRHESSRESTDRHERSQASTNRPGYRGAGVCTVLVSVAMAAPVSIVNHEPQYFDWEIVIDNPNDDKREEVVWESDEKTRLFVNEQGVAYGSAQVSVRKLLQALVEAFPCMPLSEILRRSEEQRGAAHSYQYFYLRIRLNQEFVRFPINMGSGTHPK